MLLLPAVITAREANDARRLLLQAIGGELPGAVVVDASSLQQFDSSALAVVLDCQRSAGAWGWAFELRNTPPKLAALARLYGIDVLLAPPAASASAGAQAA